MFLSRGLFESSPVRFKIELNGSFVMHRKILSAAAVLVIALLMSMTGRGGGNFYVPVLVASGIPMLEASTSGQLILICSALAALFIFQKKRTVDWKLALVIDPPTDIMAFVGGWLAHNFSGSLLKFIFSGLLVLAGFFMLRPARERPMRDGPGLWKRKFGEYTYTVNLWTAIPITAATGFFAGMIGVSGGSFKIPLMVLFCGVPMRIAVGTSSAMVAVTALMGFTGHAIAGDFNPLLALPLVPAALAGGLLGGRFSLKTDPTRLKLIFALTSLGAALFMALNAALSAS